MTQRTDRIDELLRQEIGTLLAREVGDPRIGFATITDVETTPDLRHAKVWVSVIGTPDERAAALQALARAMPFIRRQLGVRLRLRRIPDLHVHADDTLERGTRVLRLLSEIEAGTDADAAAEPIDALPTPVARLPHDGDAPEPEPAAMEPATTVPDRARRRRADRGPDRRSRPGRGRP